MLRMKALNHPFFYFLAIITLFVSSCDKGDPGTPFVPQTKTYTLYNRVGADSTVSGTVVVTEKSDGNASLKISLGDGYKLPGIVAFIVDSPTGLTPYATLNAFDAAGQFSTTNPVKDVTISASPIPYATLIGKSGYAIRIFNSGLSVEWSVAHM